MELQMDDRLKVWTTVGSAGTLDQIDLAKVHLFQSIVQLGTDLPIPTQAVSAQVVGAAPHFPTIQAVVRYNVTPVDGLFSIPDKFRYQLRIRYRGQITAKLMQVDGESGTEAQLILFNSNSFPAKPDFQLQSVSPSNDSPLLDFINKSYYVEATLIAPAIVIGHPAAISMIKIEATPDFQG
jgi:hypothetical protein